MGRDVYCGKCGADRVASGPWGKDERCSSCGAESWRLRLGAPPEKTLKIYTIGHSNMSTEEFVERLRANGIGVVVDVRSKPFSRYNPHFNRYVFAEDLQKFGIPYVWMGHSLGGVPDDPELLTRGRPDYEKIRASAPYQEALQELLRGVEANTGLGHVVALVCGEADPTGCHRRRLVGADLVRLGIELVHVLKEGKQATEHEIREGLGENQPSVFDVFG